MVASGIPQKVNPELAWGNVEMAGYNSFGVN